LTDLFMTGFADKANDVLQGILAQTVECIMLVNLDGELEYINPNGLRAFGFEDFSDVGDRRWADFWPADRQARAATAFDRARRGQQDRFEGYSPDRHQAPHWWDVSVSPIVGQDGAVTHILSSMRDVTIGVQERLGERMKREEAERFAERSDSVAREMRHRLKNQLAVVGSVAKLLSRNSDSPADLTERLTEKLQALARAQDLLTINHDEPPELGAAIAQVLEASGAGERIEVGTMPKGKLGDDAIQQMALILGELQTNSLKYGALSYDSGQITLTGTRNGSDLAIHWHEDTGRTIVPPEAEGSGFKLLQRLGSTPRSRARVQWHSRGPTIDFYVRALD
tara:strand:+ start:262 stop:1278 length:1017 start_codon:yes stop_codon:yes gene_type:complete